MKTENNILIAFILGFPANEIVMPIALMGYLSGNSLSDLPGLMQMKEILVSNGWTVNTAVCVILFSLLHWPCSTTVLTIKKETGSFKWAAVAILLPTIFGFLLCVAVTLCFKFAAVLR